LDDFSTINAESGTMVADELLVEVASTIDRVDEHDVAARLGADEFGLLLSQRQTEQRAQARLSEYVSLFHSPFATGLTDETRRTSITASIGAASFPEDGRTEQELMQRAQIALAAAKSSGGNNVTFFSRSMESIVDQQRKLSREIRDALSHNQFVLEYQPTVSLATGQIRSAEALIRWDHPTRGRLNPEEFIPLSERMGLSIEIGRWVMGRALHDIMSLEALPSGFRCFINISAPGLEDEAFVSNVRSDMALFPGAVDHFGIEVTEGAAMLNAERAIIALGALRRLGLRIAIDDFGTGYSSLSYLKRLPIDIIKLDRSFITGIPHEPSDVALTETLLMMASRFQLTSLAEGVETVAQAQWLNDRGCEYAQGFLFAKSVPLDTLDGLLRENDPFPAVNDYKGTVSRLC
jgi:diguanylate cyclase (GGDEF)-like protein